MRIPPQHIQDKLPLAARLIAERGFDAVKVEDLAEVTGVPKATLYYYFTNKEEILQFLMSRLLGELQGAIAVGFDHTGNAADRLGRMIESLLEVMASEPDACRALLAEMARAIRIPEFASALMEGFYSPVQQLLEEGMRDGSIREIDDPSSTAISIFGMVCTSGIARLMAGHDLAAKKVARQVVSLILNGVGAPQTAAAPALATAGSGPRPRRRIADRA